MRSAEKANTVSDALEALKIDAKNPHNFKDYFEQLKKGLPKKPPSFHSHTELDPHGRATPGDLEYFLCMCFHFHFASHHRVEIHVIILL